MEEIFKHIASHVALGLEAVAVIVIAWGGLRSVFEILGVILSRDSQVSHKKEIWMRFGVWLLLGLEFELAADIVKTAVAPTWIDIGQLGAIAVIRTFLNYFLERDVEKYEGSEVKKG
jgi:uncharacterized membrane protein